MKTIFDVMTHEDNMSLMDGLEVVNVSTYRGHDNETVLQGRLVLNGKVLGDISEDAWGGGLNIHVDEKKLKPIEDYIKENSFTFSYRGKDSEVDLDFYLTTLLQVFDMVGKVKRSRKKTYIYDISDNSLAHYPYAWEAKFIKHYNAKLRNDNEYVLNELMQS